MGELVCNELNVLWYLCALATALLPSGFFSGNLMSLRLPCDVTKGMVSLCGPAGTEKEKGRFTYSWQGWGSPDTLLVAVRLCLIDFYSINATTRRAVQWCGITPYLSGRSTSFDSPNKLGERVVCVRDVTGPDLGRNKICTDLDLFFNFFIPASMNIVP